MKFVCYSDWEQLPNSANELFAHAEKGGIFFSRPWFENVASALDEDQAMVLACVLAEGKVLAILPLIENKEGAWLSLKHRYTTHYSLLLADDDQAQILACMCQGLSQLSLRGLLLEPVAEDDSRVNDLEQILLTAGFSCERMFRMYNWIYHVQGQSFQDYMAARPASLRNTISRKKRKLEREYGYEFRLLTGVEVPQVMPDYYEVYRASWKASEQNVAFMDGIVADFSRLGWSRLGILYVDGKPIAAQLWFILHGKASIFRLSYDEAWKRYSPGSILTSFLMEYAIDVDKVQEIDFLTGNEAYKQDWMSDRRECFALSCIKNMKPVSTFQQYVTSVRRKLKIH